MGRARFPASPGHLELGKSSEGGTRLTLVHCGFAPDRPMDDYATDWHKFVNDLKSMIEIGSSWMELTRIPVRKRHHRLCFDLFDTVDDLLRSVTVLKHFARGAVPLASRFWYRSAHSV
jgi:hypothetical protein